MHVLLCHLRDVEGRRERFRSRLSSDHARRPWTAPARARGSTADERRSDRWRRAASPPRRSRPDACTRNRRARRAGPSPAHWLTAENAIGNVGPRRPVRAERQQLLEASVGMQPLPGLQQPQPHRSTRHPGRGRRPQRRDFLIDRHHRVPIAASPAPTTRSRSPDRPMRPNALVAACLQPLGQVGRAGHEAARRRRLEAVGIGERADRKQRIAQVQQRQQRVGGLVICGMLAALLATKSTKTRRGLPRTRLPTSSCLRVFVA